MKIACGILAFTAYLAGRDWRARAEETQAFPREAASQAQEATCTDTCLGKSVTFFDGTPTFSKSPPSPMSGQLPWKAAFLAISYKLGSLRLLFPWVEYAYSPRHRWTLFLGPGLKLDGLVAAPFPPALGLKGVRDALWFQRLGGAMQTWWERREIEKARIMLGSPGGNRRLAKKGLS